MESERVPKGINKENQRPRQYDKFEVVVEMEDKRMTSLAIKENIREALNDLNDNFRGVRRIYYLPTNKLLLFKESPTKAIIIKDFIN